MEASLLKQKIDETVDNYCFIEPLDSKNAKIHILFKMDIGTGITLTEGFTRNIFSEDGFGPSSEAIKKAKEGFKKTLTEICEENAETFRNELFKKAQEVRPWIFKLEPIKSYKISNTELKTI